MTDKLITKLRAYTGENENEEKEPEFDFDFRSVDKSSGWDFPVGRGTTVLKLSPKIQFFRELQNSSSTGPDHSQLVPLQQEDEEKSSDEDEEETCDKTEVAQSMSLGPTPTPTPTSTDSKITPFKLGFPDMVMKILLSLVPTVVQARAARFFKPKAKKMKINEGSEGLSFNSNPQEILDSDESSDHEVKKRKNPRK